MVSILLVYIFFIFVSTNTICLSKKTRSLKKASYVVVYYRGKFPRKNDKFNSQFLSFSKVLPGKNSSGVKMSVISPIKNKSLLLFQFNGFCKLENLPFNSYFFNIFPYQNSYQQHRPINLTNSSPSLTPNPFIFAK